MQPEPLPADPTKGPPGAGPVACAMAAYVTLFFFFAWRRHASFLEGDYDLGLLEQSFWTASHDGLPFYNTYEGHSHFAYHATLLYWLLLPVYAAIPRTETLILLQTVALALGAVPTWLLGRDLLGPRSGITLAVLYLLYFPLHGVNYHDVHETGFVVAPLLLAAWGLLTSRRGAAWSGAVLAMACREDVGLTVALLAAVTARRQRTRAEVVTLGVLGLAWTGFAYGWLMPHFGGGAGLFADRLADLGDTPVHVALSPLLRPAAFWGKLSSPPSLSYLLGLLGPLAFLPLWGWPLLIPTLPVLTVNLLSRFGGMHLFSSHYAGPLIPLLFAAAAVGTRRRVAQGEPAERDVAALRRLRVALALSVLTALLFDPAPLHLGRAALPVDDHARALAAFTDALPTEVSVSTQVNLWTHLTRRREAWLGYHEGVDLIVVDTAIPRFIAECGLDRTLPALVREGRYRLEHRAGTLQIYRRSPR